MVDCGSQVNLIKEGFIKDNVEIDKHKLLSLHGIESGTVRTLGLLRLCILGQCVEFHLVSETFPISQDGLLGAPFLRDQSVRIDFPQKILMCQNICVPFNDYETVTVFPRTCTPFKIRIANPEIKNGYISRLKAKDGIYLGDAVVTNDRGYAYLKCFNTTDEEVDLIVPTLPLEEFSENPNEMIDYLGNDATCFNINYSSETSKQLTRAKRVRELLRLDHLNQVERESIESLVEQSADRFQIPDEPLEATTYAQHEIHTTDNVPIHTKQYRFPPAHKEEINRQVQDLLKNGIVKNSISPYNSPVLIVPKKPDSKGNKRYRMVIDYRNLNEKTIGDAYPLPNITEILDQLGGAKYFSIFDLASGFHQIPMGTKDAEKTAFSTPYGHYQFNRMPFGLKNAPATFQRLMNNVLTGLQGQELFVYLDDIVIYAASIREHEIKFLKLIKRLRDANLKLQPDKCEFLRHEVTYLGHVIGEDGVKPDPNKISAVQNFPVPKNPKNIKQFLGLAGYYRRFIPNFSKVAKPLTDLLKKDKPFKWELTQTKAFEILKEALCKKPILQYPDFTKPFILTTDASGLAIGGILSQGEVGKDLPIAYASRLLNVHEQKYSTIEKECLAIIYSVSHFRPYLYGRKFTIITDHKPLVWLHSVKDPSSRLWKWKHKLSEYEYKIEYKAGKINLNADALSRNPPEPKVVLPIEAKRPRLPFFETRLDDTESSIPEDSDLTPPPKKPRQDLSESASDFELNLDRVEPYGTLEPEETLANATLYQTSEQIPEEHIQNIERRGSTENIASENLTEHPEVEPEVEYPSSSDDETNDETSTDPEDEELFDVTNLPYNAPNENMQNPRFVESRDSITMRKDNIIIFVDMSGNPVDNGARQLKANNSLPKLDDLTFERGKVTQLGTKYLISIPIKFRDTEHLEEQTLRNSIHSLLDVITELQLTTLSIAKSPRIDDISWKKIQSLLTQILEGQNIEITICKGLVTTPEDPLKFAIIEEFHSSKAGGHKGITKTYQRIRQHYSWDNMKKDIQTFINQCRNCQIKKLTRIKTKQPMIITDTPGSAFDKVALDIVGPLPATQIGNEYIVTMQDLLTKYSVGVPIKVANAITIADAFMKQFICRFGAPRAILTDQGSPFMTSLFKYIARKFNIKQFRTTAYHPQSNGSLERSHHVLAEYLKQYVEEDGTWDEFIELAMFSYNTSVHEGTKFSPHELVFGKIARVPSSFPPVEEDTDETYRDYLEKLFDKLRYLQEEARQNLINSKNRSKGYYDKKINPQNFKVGDKVFLLKEPSKGKLSDQYTGPHLVLDILPNSNARISYKGKSRIVHLNKLKISKLNS